MVKQLSIGIGHARFYVVLPNHSILRRKQKKAKCFPMMSATKRKWVRARTHLLAYWQLVRGRTKDVGKNKDGGDASICAHTPFPFKIFCFII